VPPHHRERLLRLVVDVDVSNVTVEKSVVNKEHGTLVPSHVPSCPDLTPEEIADALQPPTAKISGCAEAACDCVPIDPNPTWTDWLTYNANAEARKDDPGNHHKPKPRQGGMIKSIG